MLFSHLIQTLVNARLTWKPCRAKDKILFLFCLVALKRAGWFDCIR